MPCKALYKCSAFLQACNDAIQRGGGPADKVKLNLAMSQVKKLATSTHVKRHHAVGAVGYAVVQPDHRVPDNDFFEPNRKFRVRFRSVASLMHLANHHRHFTTRFRRNIKKHKPTLSLVK